MRYSLNKERRMSLNTESIRRSLIIIIKNRSVDGRLKPHSIFLHIIIWIVVLLIGVFGMVIYLSTLTVTVMVISLILFIQGSILLRNKDYGWFLYYAFNVSGGLLCMMNFRFASAQEVSSVYALVVMSIFLIFVFISSYATVFTVKKKLRNRWKRNYKKGNDSIAMPFAIFGTLISRIIPEHVGTVLSLMLAGIAIGIIASSSTTIFYYGRKYDPQADLIRQVEEEAKEKATKAGLV